MKVHGLAMCGNEKDRYLESSLTWNRPLMDTLFIYDDQSDDGSFDVAAPFVTDTVIRPDGVPTLLENEGAFRQAGYDAWEEKIAPEVGDLVFVFDLDEFWCGPDLRTILPEAATGGIIHRPEMWSIDQLVMRIDGYWAQIDNLRIFWYQPDGVYRNQELAGGSAPLYAEESTVTCLGNLMHYGYADPGDRQEKYNRYIDRPGHSPKHIRSILSAPFLQEFRADDAVATPVVWRGVKEFGNVDPSI